MALPSMRAGLTGREFLRIAGGYGVDAVGQSPAGGLDIDNAGNLATDGDITVKGVLDAQGGVANTAGDLTLDAPNNAADSTIHLKNSDATYKANVDVEGKLELDDVLTVRRSVAPTNYFLELDSSGSPGYGLRLTHIESNKKTLTIENLHDGSGTPTFVGPIDFRVGAASSPLLAMKVEEDGGVWMVGDCSALSFTDRSPIYQGDALASITDIRAKAGTERGGGWAEVDHDSLPDGVRVVRELRKYRHRQSGVEYDTDIVQRTMRERLNRVEREEDGRTRVVVLDVETDQEYDSETAWLAAHYEPVTRQELRRDIGAQIQFNLRAITQLLDRVAELESRVPA